VWQRRQEMPLQWVITVPASMKGVKRMNTAMMWPQQQGAGFRNPYTIDVDKRENRNCYNCRRFRYIARNCRNRRMGINRRIEQEEDNNNLNGNRGLMGPN